MRDMVLFSGGAAVGALIACVVMAALILGGRDEHR